MDLAARELLELLVSVPVAHLADLLEPLLDLLGLGRLRGGFLPELPVERHDRGVAVEAVARLLALGLHVALRVLLVEQHERVAAAVAVVDREEVAREDPRQPRVPRGFLGRHEAFRPAPASAVLRVCRLGGALVPVVLAGPVRAPLGRIDVVLRHLGEPDGGVPGLLLPLGDVDEQGADAEGDEGEDARDEGDEEPSFLSGLGVVCGHDVLLVGRCDGGRRGSARVTDRRVAADARDVAAV